MRPIDAGIARNPGDVVIGRQDLSLHGSVVVTFNAARRDILRKKRALAFIAVQNVTSLQK